MEQDLLEQQFGKGSTVTTTTGITNGALWQIAVKGANADVSWQQVYREVAEQLLSSIPALERAGIK